MSRSSTGGSGQGSLVATSGYRYGFNGKENDNEVKGEGNQQDYGMRVYDPRIGKFLSVDPLTKDYPFYTPYQFAGNMPIKFIDLDGLEPAEAEGVEGGAEPANAPLRVIFGTFRIPILTAPYVKYGMTSERYENERNPLSTIHQIEQAEEFRRQEAKRNSFLIKGKWVRRLDDDVTELRIRDAIESAQKLNEKLKSPLRRFDFGVYFFKKDGVTRITFNHLDMGYYEYSKENGLFFDINVPKMYQNFRIGSAAFSQAMKEYNPTKLEASWLEGSNYEGGMSINLKQYREAKDKGLGKEDAAWSTWTGIQAKLYGFDHVEVTEKKNGKGVSAVFTKTPH